LRRGFRLIRNPPAGRIDDRALAGADSGLSRGMILNLENRLIESRCPETLHVGVSIGSAPDRLARGNRRSVIRSILFAAGRPALTLASSAALLLALAGNRREGHQSGGG